MIPPPGVRGGAAHIKVCRSACGSMPIRVRDGRKKGAVRGEKFTLKNVCPGVKAKLAPLNQGGRENLGAQ